MPLVRQREPPVPKVVYVGSDGVERIVDAGAGESVMSAALRGGVPGIVGEQLIDFGAEHRAFLPGAVVEAS